MPVATLRQLLEAGIHFGHQTRRWHPKMARYVFGQRNGIYIIDLQHTLRQLQKAYDLVRDIAAAGKSVLFVGTKRQAQEPIAREAQRCGMFWVNSRWLGGTLTNWSTIRRSVRTLLSYEEMESSGQIERLPKKEATKLRKERVKLDRNLCGIKDMNELPGAMFVIDAKKEAIAVREAERLGIPCVAIIDTNCDPDMVPLPIPGNDDAIRAVDLFCRVIADAVIEGRALAGKEHAEKAAVKVETQPADEAEAKVPSADDVEPDAYAESEAAEREGSASEVPAQATE
ncbi:MAG TPA: 30S ribosomal protein S2 [Candidatus Hydrogenedentes bacterium]|nr:30S ribosomal protein S2 [Candidatus Hydrogenedentota bacterium]HIJ73155.1 30S ribosomal protein S2 [Candidatus Hydrogenedentota bacterium]